MLRCVIVHDGMRTQQRVPHDTIYTPQQRQKFLVFSAQSALGKCHTIGESLFGMPYMCSCVLASSATGLQTCTTR